MLQLDSFQDAEEQAAALTGWDQSYLQVSGGRFDGTIKRVQLEGVNLFVEHLDTAVHQTGHLADHVLALGLPIHCEGHSWFCGEPSHPNALHIFSGRSGFEFLTGPDHLMMGIELPAEVTQSLYPEGGATLIRSHAGLIDCDPTLLRPLIRLVETLFEAAQNQPEIFDQGATGRHFVDSLCEKITALNLSGRQCSHPTDQHWHWVQETRQLVEQKIQSDHSIPTIGEICAQLGVSRRTLQSAFHRILDTSPLHYVRTIRLHAVRQALKTADSVTNAATDKGFWHFGHFAHEYHRIFGELPSATHQRYRKS